MPVIGFLNDGSPQTRREYLDAFLKGLAETGYIEGRNVAIEYRWAEDHSDRLPALADLVRRQVAVIATPGTTASALAARNATKDIPIVFLVGTDPIKIALVASLNRPGGNLTGVATLAEEVTAKRVELLHETVPAATLIAYLGNPANAVYTEAESRAIQAGARILNLRALTLTAGTAGEIDATFEDLTRQQVGALLLSGDPLFASHSDRIVALAALHRIPTMYRRRDDVVAGGLMSYGTDFADAWRQVGVYTGRILKGERPADLPVQRATKTEMFINLKTAKALGLTVPQSILLRADEVIE
jgi:putative tryptophan/tyrosine transport system substrate-binding protein